MAKPGRRGVKCVKNKMNSNFSVEIRDLYLQSIFKYFFLMYLYLYLKSFLNKYLYLYFYLVIEKTAILNTNTFYLIKFIQCRDLSPFNVN